MPNPNKKMSTEFLPWLAESAHANARGVKKQHDDMGVTGYIEPALLNSYADPPSPMTTLKYRLWTRQDNLEFIGHLDANAATSGTVAFVLIEPFWRSYDISFLTDIYDGANFAVARCFIDSTNGEVSYVWPAV